MRTKSEITPQTELGRLLRQLLDESVEFRGDMKALSLGATLGETAVRDVISGKSRRPTRDTLAKLAAALKVDVGLLENAANQPSTASEPTTVAFRRQVPRNADVIPIKSAGRGGGEQEMFVETLGFTPRPANLAGVREAYAVYMVGDSMEPRYEQGWLLHVNPYRPPSRGRDVVVYKVNDAVLVKRFIRKSPIETILEQLNPREEIRVPNSEIRELHLIVGSDQEGG